MSSRKRLRGFAVLGVLLCIVMLSLTSYLSVELPCDIIHEKRLDDAIYMTQCVV
jgi:hypothetical protein